MTLETTLEITSRGSAAIVFQALATADFRSIVRDMEEVVKATAQDSGTTVETSEDSYGFSWLVLRGKDFDQLVVGINAVGTALVEGGYGERLLCAVFAFQDATQHPIYWIYNYKRGSFYPFVPGGRSSSSATTNASSCSRPRSAPSYHSSRAPAMVPALGDPDLTGAPAAAGNPMPRTAA